MSKGNSGQPAEILLVDDHPGDVRLFKEAFKQGRFHNDLHVINRGTDALDFLHQRGNYEEVPQPDLILLDPNLPDMDGMKILQEIKESAELNVIPVIILTSSETEEEIVKSYCHQANAYLTKPPDSDEFLELCRSIGDFWIQFVRLPPDEP